MTSIQKKQGGEQYQICVNNSLNPFRGRVSFAGVFDHAKQRSSRTSGTAFDRVHHAPFGHSERAQGLFGRLRWHESRARLDRREGARTCVAPGVLPSSAAATFLLQKHRNSTKSRRRPTRLRPRRAHSAKPIRARRTAAGVAALPIQRSPFAAAHCCKSPFSFGARMPTSANCPKRPARFARMWASALRYWHFRNSR
jgi:hypothetical protein